MNAINSVSPTVTPSDSNCYNPKADSIPLRQIYFYLTAGCNLACRHCWLSPKLQDENHSFSMLPLELFRSILNQGKELGLNAVKLTGGEPLMHPHIQRLINIVEEKELSLSIESNGVLCTPQLAQAIAQIKNHFIAISLDSADAKTHEEIRGIKGCFMKAVNGIVNLIHAGVRPQIIMTVMRRNVEHIPAMIRLAEYLGANSLKFNVVQPTGRGEHLREKDEALSVEEILQIGDWITNIESKKAKVKLYFSVPPAFRNLSKMFGNHADGCSRCGIYNILGVLADGKYALCGIGSQVPELIFGDAGKDSLSEIWKNNPILNEIRTNLPRKFEGVCGKCHMKLVCFGSCIAQNYYRTGSLFKSYWFCEEAYRKGLFPTTRMTTE